MKVALLCLVIASCASPLAAQETAPPAAAAEAVTTFLSHVQEGRAEEALKQWDPKVVDDKLKERVKRMIPKLASLGGVKRVDVGTCEQRRIDAYKAKTGETISVVPVEIVCGETNIVLAVFSVRRVEGQEKIFMAESEKGWGGTASLDDEVGYQH